MYDIIGDIHGHAYALEMLLVKLRYEKINGYYKHPDRKAIFVGDFIDRGPMIREVLDIVRKMNENGSALAVMGNHEYNALCFHTNGVNGEPLRKHNENNKMQHKATTDQFAEYNDEWISHLDWFRELPVFLELGDLRIVHACWDPENIKLIPGDLKFTEDFLIELHKDENYKKSKIYIAIDECLKGRELKIPEGKFFCDRQGKKRDEMRIKWYLDPRKCNYEDYYMEEIPEFKGKKVDVKSLKNEFYYGETEKPVIFGHYWFKGTPKIEKENVVCVDYSVAKGGKLTAYRWNGEKELTDKNFVWVTV